MSCSGWLPINRFEPQVPLLTRLLSPGFSTRRRSPYQNALQIRGDRAKRRYLFRFGRLRFTTHSESEQAGTIESEESGDTMGSRTVPVRIRSESTIGSEEMFQ